MRGEDALRITGGGLGVALLLGGAVFSHAWACGCTKAEILAINDDGEGVLFVPGLSRPGTRFHLHS